MSVASDFDSTVLAFMQDDPLTVSYISSSQGVTNYETGEYLPTTVATPCKALLLDLTRNGAGLSTKFGLQIVQGDKELYLQPPEKANPLVAPLVITPGSDKIIIGSVTYTVAYMTEINPTGASPILYNFMLKR